jgi:chaperone modulatory protein CbpM
MSNPDTNVCVGAIVEEEWLSLTQLCALCDAQSGQILELVEEGVLEVSRATELRFAGASLRRAQLAVRLQRDLGVNPAGVALVIELLERIEALERQLRD